MQIIHFTPKDLFYSDTAIEHKINNFPATFQILDNLVYSAQQMEKIREHLGHPIYINSWYRCQELNRLLGSNDTSQHLKGEAVDFVCPSFSNPEKVCSEIIESGVLFDQLIWEKKRDTEWVHCSFVKEGKNRKQYLELI